MRTTSILPNFTIALISASSLVSGNTHDYAPTRIQCPKINGEWVRRPNGLNAEEAAWVQARKQVVYQDFEAYLRRLGIADMDFDLDRYLSLIKENNYNSVPVIAFATSGGGTASAFTGTGAYNALDARVPDSVRERTGGLLQSMTYVTGQSGGSWPTIGFPSYGFPTATEMVQHWEPWVNKQSNATTVAFFENIVAKYKSGYNVTISDFYGQQFGYQYLQDNGTLPFSNFTDIIRSHDMPMPFLTIASVSDTSQVEYGFKIPAIDGSDPLYEITPFEFGTWGGTHGSPAGFIPTRYLGTTMQNGQPLNDTCTINFDRSSTILGMAAAAQNFWQIEHLSNGTLAPFSKRAISSQSEDLNSRSDELPGVYAIDELLFGEFSTLLGLNETSTYPGLVPNPFRGLADQPSYYQKSEFLTLVDGTETGQGLPLQGLIQPARKTKFIIAWDDDEDASYLWNNGTNLYNAYLAATANHLPFPKIPQISTMLARGYNLHPTFFGCNTSLTTTGDRSSPIIAYMANAPYSAYTNYSGVSLDFTRKFMGEILTNSFNLVTQGNGTWDKDWAVCLGCAALDRSREEVGMARSGKCEKCFDRYCWDGNEESQVVDPSLLLSPNVSFAMWNATQ